MKQISRRLFTRNIGFSSAMLAMHPSAVFSNSISTEKPRILDLKVYTSASLSVMKEFYVNQLELELMSFNSKELTVMAGKTPLTFLYSTDAGDPWYHFAFNISENKILSARNWQKQRTSFVTFGSHLVDPKYPDDVVHFNHWNAHSLFFWDPAGNLLEHIARHDLQNSSSGAFSSEDILNVSEIGLIVDDVSSAARFLRASLKVSNYKGGSDMFTALGDENGLIIMMKTGRDLGGKSAKAYPVQIKVEELKNGKVQVPNYPFVITS